MNATVIATDRTLQPEAPAKGATATKSTVSQVVSFRLAEELYGINILAVQEIILMGVITTIPDVPQHVRGLINLRGKVFPVIDLRLRFGFEAAEYGDDTRIIVTHGHGRTIGFVVDAAQEVLRIDAEQIEPLPTGITSVDATYITGVVQVDERLMILLNSDAVICQEQQDVIESSVATSGAGN